MNRKSISLVAVAALLLSQVVGLLVEPAAAQGTSMGPLQVPRASTISQIQDLWETYRTKYAGSGKNGREILDQILSSRSLPATKENIASVLSLLRSNVTREEKDALTRLIGALYLGIDDPQARGDIQRFLSAMARNTDDPALGRVTALTYSRLAYFPDSLAVLAHARSVGFIKDNEYFGNIAHLLPAAPAGDQPQFLKLLSEANNGYSREILANLLKDKEILKSLTPAASATAAGILARFEPTFSNPANAFGGFELLRYEDWISASVALNAQISGEPERIVMARMLTIDGADPRKLIAVLSSESASIVVRAAFDRRSLEKIDTAIANFAKQNSGNPYIQELVGVARANLVEPRK
jgi:hypothetical protein